jgi:hypothetical protein
MNRQELVEALTRAADSDTADNEPKRPEGLSRDSEDTHWRGHCGLRNDAGSAPGRGGNSNGGAG